VFVLGDVALAPAGVGVRRAATLLVAEKGRQKLDREPVMPVCVDDPIPAGGRARAAVYGRHAQRREVPQVKKRRLQDVYHIHAVRFDDAVLDKGKFAKRNPDYQAGELPSGCASTGSTSPRGRASASGKTDVTR